MHEPPLSPLGEPESKKIGFVAPIFASSEISKTINVLSKHGYYNQCHNKLKMKWYTNIEQNGTFKIPHFRNMLMS